MDKKPINITQNMYKSGEIFRQRRESLGISLETAATETKIKKEYLEKIEENHFETFQSDIFVTGYIKIYASYLNLNVDRMLAIFRRDNPKIAVKQQPKKGKEDPSTLFTTRKEKILKYVTPKSIVAALLSIFILSIFAYLGIQYRNFQNPPSLNISQPQNNIEVDQPTILISGSTDPDSLININNNSIETNLDGTFETQVTLLEGINNISIDAIKESNENAIVSRVLTITYKIPESAEESTENGENSENTAEQEQIVEEEPKENKVLVSINNAEAWTVISVDNQQVAAQVLPAGYSEEFVITENFSISSGRPANTSIQINGVDTPLVIDTASGTGELICSIENNDLLCQ